MPGQSTIKKSRPRLAAVLLIVLVWLVIGAVNFGLSSVDGLHSIRAKAGSLTSLCGIPISLVVYVLTQRIRHFPAWQSRTCVAMLVLLAGTILWLANTSFQAWVAGHAPVGHLPTDWFMRTHMNWLYFTALVALQTAISSLFDVVHTLHARDRQLTEARLAALRFQLNPHFLFNTLNAIATLAAEAGAKEAELMISRLSVFLRTSLSGEPTDMVSLAAELEMIGAYLDIESVRFGERLNVRYACEAGLTDALVPNFILQPLVENAVKYAVAPAQDPVTIELKASFSGDALILSVEDDAPRTTAMPASGMGLGLRNVAARLETLYGPVARLETRAFERGFAVTLTFPLRWVRA